MAQTTVFYIEVSEYELTLLAAKPSKGECIASFERFIIATRNAQVGLHILKQHSLVLADHKADG